MPSTPVLTSTDERRNGAPFRSLSRLATRQVLLAIVVVILAMVALALLAEAMSGGGGTVYLAEIQPSAGTAGVPSLVAVGYGKASAPAETAELQLQIMSNDDYSSGPVRPTPEATPVDRELQAAAPIVAKIVEAGAPAEAVHVISGDTSLPAYFGPPGLMTFRIDVTLHSPQLETIQGIVDSASRAAAENDLRLVSIGTAYGIQDCSGLRAEAWRASVQDARARAAAQAELLEVQLGELVLSQETAVGSALDLLGAPAETGGCAPQELAAVDPYSFSVIQTTLPAFDPTAPPVVVAYAQVNLAFEIVRD